MDSWQNGMERKEMKRKRRRNTNLISHYPSASNGKKEYLCWSSCNEERLAMKRFLPEVQESLRLNEMERNKRGRVTCLIFLSFTSLLF
jgi:hypothetical protein